MKSNASLVLMVAISLAAVARAEVIDIKGSPKAKPVLDKLNSILPKVGNQGSTEITSLYLDTVTLEVVGHATIKAKHSWGKVPAPTLTNPSRKVEVAAEKKVKTKFKYNLETQRISGKVDLGDISVSIKFGGVSYKKSFARIKVDLERLQRAMQGDIVTMIELIPTPNIVEVEGRDEYERIRQSKWDLHGRDNVYFASKPFVNWASPERGIVWIIEGVLTSGASISKAFAEVKAESLKEATALLRWLQKKGVAEASGVANKLLSGKKVNWPHIAVKWQTIKYESRRKIAGKPVTPWIPLRHAAFYFVWTGDGGSDKLDDDVRDDANDIVDSGGQSGDGLGTGNANTVVHIHKHEHIHRFENSMKIEHMGTVNHAHKGTVHMKHSGCIEHVVRYPRRILGFGFRR